MVHGEKKVEVVKQGFHVEAMSKTTFYFVIVVMILVDIIQSRYQKKISLKKQKMHGVLEG